MPPYRRIVTPALTAIAAAAVLFAAVVLVRQVGDRLRYRSEDVQFENGETGLVGTVTRPKSKDRLPGVVIIPGPELHPQLYAGMFARHGFVALTYHGRGEGTPQGDPDSQRRSDVRNPAGNAVAAVRYLRSRDDVDAYNVGLFAGGEGCRVAPAAAATVGRLAFMVQVSAPLAEDETAEVDPFPVLREIDVPVMWVFGDPDLDRTADVRASMETVNVLKRSGKDYVVKVYAGHEDPLASATGGLAALWRGRPCFEAGLFSWLQGRVDAASKTRDMIGMFTYMADAGLFMDCLTAKRLPVAHEGDNPALERAYMAATHAPPDAVLVTVRGYVAPRPAMEGGGSRDFVIVERFLDIWPGETCESSTVKTPITNTYWKLVELNGAAIEPHEKQREVHIILEQEDNRVRGFAGCNGFFGDYELDGNSVKFGQLASTMAACPYLEEETALFGALEKITTYKIIGETLELRGEGDTRIRARAVHLE
jgi:heat shock protein HslJ/dienelactone hydrolase